MKKFFALIFFAFVFVMAAEEESLTIKNPWYTDFDGNTVFSSFQLEEQLEVPEEFGVLDTSKQDFLMRLAMENIRAIYYSRGYFSLDLQMDVISSKTTSDSLERGFVFYITEGDRYQFAGIDITTNGDQLEMDVEKLKTSKPHNYDQNDISIDLQTIQNTYRKEGYLHVNLSALEKIDTVAKKIYVEVNVTPGAKVIMGNMVSRTHRAGDRKENANTAGLSDTAWLSTLWRIPKGEVIDGKQYNSFKNKLFSTQLFTQIRLTDSLRTDSLSDVHLDVTERVPGEVRYGFFFEEIYGFGVQAYARHRNFFGRFNEFSTNFQIAQHKQEISVGYANPLLFGTSFTIIPTAIRFDDKLTYNHEKITPPAYPDSIEERYEVINRANLTFGITNNIRFRGTLDTRYVNKNDDKMFKLKGEIALTFDYTNDYFNPTKGIRVFPTFGAGTNLDANSDATSIIGSPYTYGELTANLYYPLFWTFGGALSGSCGKFFNKAIEDDARVFYQGGSRSVRGYRFRSIYASYDSYDEDGEKIINTGLTPIYFRLNQEIRWTFPFKSMKNWQIVQFFDWAKVMDSEEKVYEAESDASLGLGIRYRWQFLTFRLDYAFKKNFDDFNFLEKFKWGRFAFDLSQTF